MKTLLENLITFEVGKILKEEETSPQPEATEDDIFGKYLWADKKHPPKRKDNAPAEKNTEYENELFGFLYQHVTGDLRAMKMSIASYLRPEKRKGNYLKFIAPPKQLVYRGLHNVSIERAAKLLGVSEETIRGSLEGTGPHKIKPNAIVGGNKHVASWTINKNVANIFAAYKKTNNSSEEIGVVLVADPYENNNDFYLNPENLSKAFNNLGQYVSEKEVVSYGPVSINHAYLIDIS